MLVISDHLSYFLPLPHLPVDDFSPLIWQMVRQVKPEPRQACGGVALRPERLPSPRASEHYYITCPLAT